MGILARFGSIMSANFNALLDKCEDPAKMVEQYLRDAEKDLQEVTKETAAVMANEKSAERKLKECEKNIEKYGEAARKAVAAGDDAGARLVLSKKQSEEKKLASLQDTYNTAHANSEKMRQLHDKLMRDIDELKSRKDAVKAKISTAKAQEHMNKMTSGINAGSSIAAFERMEEKANKMLDSAEAAADLQAGSTTADDVVDKYLSGGDSAVDDELAKLKAEMGVS